MERWKGLIRSRSAWLILLASALLLPLVTDLAANWLTQTFGQTPTNLARLVAIIVAVAVAAWVLGLVLRPRPEPTVLVPRDQRPPRGPGLIALVGRGRPGDQARPLDEPAAHAIRYHLGEDDALKVCWLVASTGEKGSVPVAREIRRAFEDRCTVHVRPTGDGFSVQDTYDTVQKIYNEEIYDDEHREFGLEPGQVIADFTGGTAPMTAGLVLACGKYRPMQYTTGRKVEYGPPIRSLPLLVEFRPTPRRRGV